jgi:hypothetical protein
MALKTSLTVSPSRDCRFMARESVVTLRREVNMPTVARCSPAFMQCRGKIALGAGHDLLTAHRLRQYAVAAKHARQVAPRQMLQDSTKRGAFDAIL